MATVTKPYVGVCGVSSVGEAMAVASLMKGAGFSMETKHTPMIGFLVSWESIELGPRESFRNPKRFPVFKELPAILGSVKGEVQCAIHYCTDDLGMLLPNLSRVLEYGDMYREGLVGAVQINGVLPEPWQLRSLKTFYPDLKVIAQVSPEAILVAGSDEELREGYGGLDYILIDGSRGSGKEFDMTQTVAAFKAVTDAGVPSSVAIAGGLNGENVRKRAKQLIRSIGNRNFSIDAEEGLRNGVSGGRKEDLINLDKTREFLHRSFGVLVE